MAKLGIDLGTSNSCAAVVFDIDRKNPVTIEPNDGPFYGDLVYPSYVAFSRKGESSAVGLPARERFFSHGQSDLVVRHFKRLIGRPYEYVAEKILKGDRAFTEFKGRLKKSSDGLILITVGERDMSIIEVASYLLKKIYDDAQEFVQKRGEAIDSVTMSVPTGLDTLQRQATIEAAKLAGFKANDIQLVEEPTAAAIAWGLRSVEGETMVINVGAGTTDVIIGYMDSTTDKLMVTMPNQDCDDLLGGMDMDDEILKFVSNNDTGLPKLKDIYGDLPMDQRLRLLGRIEEAKIVASREGSANISIVLNTEKIGSKKINVPLDEKILGDIVRPILNGYMTNDNRLKGIRPVIDRALIKAAGGNTVGVPKVINEIQWLILIGGPCRMKCIHELLKDVFKSNKMVVTQIDNLDRSARLIKEGVAHGAALYQDKGLNITSSVPWTIGILHESGMSNIINSGTPYSDGQGVMKSINIPVHQGSNQFWIVFKKESQQSIREWSMYSHIVNVPQEGQLQVTLQWDVVGTKANKVSVQGCGLGPPPIEFPQMETTTLAKELENRFEWYLGRAKDLRNMTRMAREYLPRLLVSRGWTASDANTRADELLGVSNAELTQADSIDVDSQKELKIEDIEIAMKSGYIEMRKQVSVKRGLLTESAVEILNRDLSTLMDWTPTTIAEMINESNKLLNLSRNCSTCIQFWQQLNQWLHKLELNNSDHAVGSATATALGALADCLYGEKVITEEDFYRIRDLCWKFYGER